MAGEAKTTTDHKQIQEWAEKREGKPAQVKATAGKNDPGLLRIDFPGYRKTDSLQEISWDDFFKKFDEKTLAFLYQETMKDGSESRFFKLISRTK
jgi:hypothetical protein